MITMRRRVGWIVLLVALPVAADAPPDQYDQFDRDTVTIHDRFTQLEWLRDPGTRLPFADAQLYCDTRFGSSRVPTVKEALTILDEEPHTEYEFGKFVTKMIDALAFPITPVDEPYWTSTSAGPGQAWTVDFSTGRTAPRATTSTGNLRCVR
jgi:hypothetical protein